jgi:hypothetical protein
MSVWVHTILEAEDIALDTCKELVRQGRVFTVERVTDGWLFMVFLRKGSK